MKLVKVVIPANRTSLGPACVRFSRKGGIIFSTLACEKLGIKVGDKVDFYQDEENPKDWYVGKSEDSKLVLRPANSDTKTNSLRIGSSYLVGKIAGYGKSAKFLLAGEPIEDNIFAILTTKNLLDEPEPLIKK